MKVFRALFIICFLICLIFVLKLLQAPETNLVSAFFSTNGNNQNYISKLSKISNNRLNIIIESDNLEENKEIKAAIENELDLLNKNNSVLKDTLKVYKEYPGNFLTPKNISLLKKKDYKILEENSLQMLYSPLGLYIATPDKDPYLFATDFALNNQKYIFQDVINKNEKVYSLLTFECQNSDDIKTIKGITDKINVEASSKIYLSGTPIHTYETQNHSSIEINIFCILSVLMLILLCKSFFGSTKIILPIALSIVFGLFFGFTFSTLIFKKLHILTFVFSTSLIGISLDYSLHYYLSGQDKEFRKSLFVSLLSTIITFSVLYYSGIEVLKQISLFVSFGLIGVYLFVFLILPLFKIPFTLSEVKSLPINKYKKAIIIVILAVIISGVYTLKFDDNIKNLYNPSKKLLHSEIMYKDLFNNNPMNFIIVKGQNNNEILEEEEKIAQKLNDKGIKCLALNNFIASEKKQKENLELIKTLYKSRLNSYANFLSEETKQELLKDKKIYSTEDFPLNSKFMLDKNTSFMMIFSNNSGYKTFNITSEMNNILKDFRHKFFKIIPLIFIFLFVVIKFFYSWQQTIRIILPSFLGGIFALCCTNFISNGLNVFHLLAFILSLGFSMDYSIFRIQGGKNSSFAIFISCISTVFSFMLLSFAGFKLISSLSIVLSLGIFTSYILSLLLISPKKETENI